MTPLTSPRPSLVDRLERLARTELSFPARLAHVLLALVAAAMTTVVLSLWLTEPALPRRTAMAFAMLTIIGLGWMAYSGWVLSSRRVMLARQRVIAGRLAVVFSSAFTAGCSLLAFAAPARAWPALAMSLLLTTVALVLWRRAESAHARLLARRAALEQALGREAS